MAIGVKFVMLTVSVAWLQLVAAKPSENEASLDGPRGLKVFVGRRGGAIRLYRELPPPPPPNDRQQQNDRQKPEKEGGEKKNRPPRRSGEITVSFGRIQEVDSSSNAISGNHGVKNPNNVDFTVTTAGT